MHYQLYEFQAASFTPLRWWALANVALYGNPFSPFSYNSLGQVISATSELVLRTTHRYVKPAFGLDKTQINGNTVEVTEHVVLEKSFCKLLHFKRNTQVEQPKVLLVAPLSGHYATLLRDTVRALLPDHDIYITDWVDARMVPLTEGPFHFDDYVCYIQEFIRFLGPGAHVISVCQPTVPVLAAVSLMAADGEAAQPTSMTMMGGPIDARQSPTAVNSFASGKTISWFENKVIDRVPAKYPGYMRRVYPGFLQLAGFLSMNPDRHFNSHKDYFNYLVRDDEVGVEAHRKFYDEYNAVMDLPAEYYLDTIKKVFIEHLLPRGKLVVRGQLVRPAAIRNTALFTIEGELDDISGHGQTAAAHDLCENIPTRQRRHLTASGAGHFGIFSGQRFRTNIYPQIRDFIREHISSEHT
jgi:poly(3-hydroxybutyrate) depolymerase